MKRSGLFQIIKQKLIKASPDGALAAVFMSLIVLAVGIFEDKRDYLEAAVLILCPTLVMMISGLASSMFLKKDDVFSDYDKEIIGKAFSAGKKKQLFLNGFDLFRNDENEDALEYFRELNTLSLTDNEKGVLAFYTAICYNRLGYSTNAGQQAIIAAEHNIQPAESLLMAARSFNLSASYQMAAECYEKLLVLSEERGIFPFLYNEIGKMYLSANDTKNSRVYFDKAVEKNLDPITAQGGLALVDLMDGREDEACERYRLALIARIGDTEGYKDYCAQICTANGYPENFFEEHLRERFHRKGQ